MVNLGTSESTIESHLTDSITVMRIQGGHSVLEGLILESFCLRGLSKGEILEFRGINIIVSVSQ